jgi:hypothetical protein
MLFRLRMLWQKLTMGYSDEEIWNLHITISEFVLPRLKEFKAQQPQYVELDDLYSSLDQMISAFQEIANDDVLDSETYENCKAGLLLFGEHFMELWY